MASPLGTGGYAVFLIEEDAQALAELLGSSRGREAAAQAVTEDNFVP